MHVKNIILIIFSSLVCLFLAELTLRLIKPIPDRSILVKVEPSEKQSKYGWGLAANEIRIVKNPDTQEEYEIITNSAGWSDVEHKIEKPKGTIRLLFLGDSFTYGTTMLEDSYFRQVERLLNQKVLENIEVIAMGEAAYGTDQELEVLIQEGINYQPDFVILQFCANDIINNLRPLPIEDDFSSMYSYKPIKYNFVEGELVKSTQEFNNSVFERRLVNSAKKTGRRLFNSHLVYYFEKVLNKLCKKYEYCFKGETLTYCSINIELFPYVNLEKTEEDNDSKYAWAVFEGILNKMKEVSENNDADFLVFSVEDSSGNADGFLRYRHFRLENNVIYAYTNGRKYEIDFGYVSRRLSRICHKNNIPIIPQTMKYDRWQSDSHFNPEGNLGIATDIVNSILEYEPFRQTSK